MLVGLSFVQDSHVGAVDGDGGVVLDGHHLDAVVAVEITVHSDILRAENTIGHQLIAHQIRTPAKQNPTCRVVVHGDGDALVRGHCGPHRMGSG